MGYMLIISRTPSELPVYVNCSTCHGDTTKWHTTFKDMQACANLNNLIILNNCKGYYKEGSELIPLGKVNSISYAVSSDVLLYLFNYRVSIQVAANAAFARYPQLNGAAKFTWFETTTNTGCYLFNINPALAIIINHNSFFNENLHLGLRYGSDKDIAGLQAAFRTKKIPYYIINDGSYEDVQLIMQKLRTTNFAAIKDIYIVIMSHGNVGDVIYTKTQSYSIRDDIVLPLLANTTLNNVQKFIITNACRGEFNPFLADPTKVELKKQELQTIAQSATIYPQNEKLMMIFSTQQGCISTRWHDYGSIFVEKFSKRFAENFDEKPMEAICQETLEDMDAVLFGDQIPEFPNNENLRHMIAMNFLNFFNYKELLHNLAVSFKSHFKERFSEEGNILDLENKKRLRQEDYEDLIDKNLMKIILSYMNHNEAGH